MEKGDFSFLESIFIVRAGIVFELKIVYYYLKEGAIVRRKSLYSIPGLCLISIAWYLYTDQQITVNEVGTQAWVIPFSNVDDLINHPQANLIVKATVTSNSQPKTYVLEEKIGIERKRMFTEVIVDQVLKCDNRVTSSQSISIIEPTYITDNGLKPGKTEFPTGLYRKAGSGKTYIFLLTWNEQQQAYNLYGVHQGKYNIDGSDSRESEIEMINENYRLLKASIKERLL